MTSVDRVRGSVCVVILLALLVAAPAAHADDALRDSEDLIQRGIELRQLGKNRDALDAFVRAYAIHATPRGAAQIALARQAIGDWLRAEQGFEQALHAGDDAWIGRYRDLLEQSIATVRGHLGWLSVETNVTEGALLLNDAAEHALPVSEPIRVVAGAIALEVRSTGYIPARREVDVAPGATTRILIALERVPLAPAPAAHGSPTTPDGSRPGVEPKARSRLSFARTLAWTSIGAGGAGLLGGIAAGAALLVTKGQLSQKSDCVDVRCGPGEQALVDRYNGLRTGSAIGFWIGGPLSAAGLVLLLATPPPTRPDARIWLSPTGAGLAGLF